MRITGGELRGRRLASFKGLRIRPTSDRVREAIFDLLGQDMEGLCVLDLFAGTGALGIDALSRGARTAVFVENSNEALLLIRKNLVSCAYERRSRVLRKDLAKGLPEARELSMKVDLVFADPPYRKGYLLPLLQRLSAWELLSSPARVVFQAARDEELPDRAGTLEAVKTRVYGETRVAIYTNDGQEP